MSFVEFLDQLCEYYYFIEIRTTRSTVLCKPMVGKRYLQLNLIEFSPYIVLAFQINAFERYIKMLVIFL